jgi:uncharacterized membrane protein
MVSSFIHHASWRGFKFFCEDVSSASVNSIVIHNPAYTTGQKAQHLGALGKAFSVTALFSESLNGKQGLVSDYYPFGWLRLQKMLDERIDGGIFDHPLFGNVLCQVERYSVSVVGGDGISVSIDFVTAELNKPTFSETLINKINVTGGSQLDLSATSPTLSADDLQRIGIDLDAIESEFMGRIADVDALTSQSGVELINTLSLKLDALASKYSGIGSSSGWLIRQAILSLRAVAIERVKATGISSNKRKVLLLQQEMPALQAIASLYDVPDNHVDQFVRINGIEDPLRVPPGEYYYDRSSDIA